MGTPRHARVPQTQMNNLPAAAAGPVRRVPQHVCGVVSDACHRVSARRRECGFPHLSLEEDPYTGEKFSAPAGNGPSLLQNIVRVRFMQSCIVGGRGCIGKRRIVLLCPNIAWL